MMRGVIFFCFAATLGLAQGDRQTLSQGDDLVDAYQLTDDSVALQIGRTILRTRVSGGTPAVTGLLRLSPETFVFDLEDDGVVSIGSDGIRRQTFSLSSPNDSRTTMISSEPGKLFRGRPSINPLQRRMLFNRSGLLAPTLSGFDYWLLGRDSADRKGELKAHPSSEQTLGWGLGYRMSSRVTLPSLSIADLNGDGSDDILLRSEGKLQSAFAQKDTWSELQMWGKAPRELDTEVVNFQQRVPSITADVNGDSCADHFLFDPGAGCLFFYSSKKRQVAPCNKQPDQIIKVSGWVLHGSLFDIDGDGKKELFLLSIPKLNLLGQLRAFKKSMLSVQLEVRKITSDGLVSRSPLLRRRCELPVVISLTRNRRICNYRAFLAPVKTPTGWSLLLPAEDGQGTSVQAYDGVEPVGNAVSFWPPLAADSHFTRPFAPITLQGGGQSSVIGVVRSPAGGAAILNRLN